MKAQEAIYNFFNFQIEEPETFGLFHFVSLAIIVFLTTLLCKYGKNHTEKQERYMALAVWIILILFETYKQIISAVTLEYGIFTWDYDFHDLPFQLCSTPLYVLPFIAFLPSGKIREAFAAFYGTFTLLGGIAVCIYPGTVFVETLGIDIQTMVWHGSQVLLGIYFNLRRFASKNPPDKNKYFVSALPIFLVFVAVAVTLNITIRNALLSAGIDDTVDMFFISPYVECILPILSTIQANTPYPVFVFVYTASLSIFAYALLSIETAIIRIFQKRSLMKGNSNGKQRNK